MVQTFIPLQQRLETHTNSEGVVTAHINFKGLLSNEQQRVKALVTDFLQETDRKRANKYPDFPIRNGRARTSTTSSRTSITSKQSKQSNKASFFSCCCKNVDNVFDPLLARSRTSSVKSIPQTFVMQNVTGKVLQKIIENALFDDTAEEKKSGYCRYLGVPLTDAAKAGFSNSTSFWKKLTKTVVNTMSEEDKNRLKTNFQHFIESLKDDTANREGIRADLAGLICQHGSFISTKTGSRFSPINFVLTQWFFEDNLRNSFIKLIEDNFVQNENPLKIIVESTDDRLDFGFTGKKSIPDSRLTFYIPKTSDASNQKIFNHGIKIDLTPEANPSGASLVQGLAAYQTLTAELVNSGYYIVSINPMDQPYLITQQYQGNKMCEACSILYMGSTDPEQAYLHPDCIIGSVDAAGDSAKYEENPNFGEVPQVLVTRAEQRQLAVDDAQAQLDDLNSIELTERPELSLGNRDSVLSK